jgi:nitrite reductase/ring-hydroxylating ferredoxin subunit
MSATVSLGSFVVNLGRLLRIPRGEARVFRIGGQPVAVFHTSDAHVYATESSCPYRECALSDAMIRSERITCPRHGLAFDLSNGQPVGNACRSLRIYPARVSEDGDILIGIEGLLAAR